MPVVPTDPNYMALHVPAALYPEALNWLVQRMGQGPAPAATAGGAAVAEVREVFREVFGKPHKATVRVAALARAMLAGDPARWWTSTEIQELLGIGPHEFRSTWRALTRHFETHYPDSPQPFQRDGGRAHGLGETTVYRLAPDLVEVVRAALA